jgi:hypothetical protein
MIKNNLILKTLTLALLSILSSCSNNFTYIAGGEDKKGFVDGFAKDAKFKYPSEMAVDEETGNLYVLDQSSTVIRKITTDGKVSTIFDLSKYPNDFDTEYKKSITDIRVNKDYLYFSTDPFIARIKLNGESSYEKFLGTGNRVINSGDIFLKQESDFINTSFANIRGFDFDDNGNLFILDAYRIKKADVSTKKVSDIYLGNTYISKEYNLSGTIFYDLEFNIKTKELTIISKTSDGMHSNASKKSTIFDNTFSLISLDFIIDTYIDNLGNTYVVSSEKESIFKFDVNKSPTKIFSLKDITKSIYGNYSTLVSYQPMYLAVDNKRNILYISLNEDNKIFKVNLK